MSIFTEHPEEVGETYFQHMAHSFSFGWRMLKAGFCCLCHGLFPFMFEKTGSGTITELHDCMVLNRKKLTAAKKTSCDEADMMPAKQTH